MFYWKFNVGVDTTEHDSTVNIWISL